MDAIKYLETRKRMCKNSCTKCPLYFANNGTSVGCKIYEHTYSAEAVLIVEKWAEEHPHKTCLSDFLEKFPEAVLDDEGIPFEICVNILGYEVNCDLYKGKCVDCWNSTLEGKVRND